MSKSSLAAFPSTHWTMVGGVNGTDSQRLEALTELLRRYLPAMRSYLIAKYQLGVERTDDLLQGFLADKVLEENVLKQADRTRGRFRSFLITVLDRFVLNRIRADKTSKRSPGKALASLAEHPALDRAGPEPADVFDLQWARQALKLAVERMREECRVGGRADLWAVFDGRVLRPTLRGQPPRGLDQLVKKLGVSPERVSTLLGTAKRMFARNLRAVVGRYEDGSNAAEEVRQLKEILSKPLPDARSAEQSCNEM